MQISKLYTHSSMSISTITNQAFMLFNKNFQVTWEQQVTKSSIIYMYYVSIESNIIHFASHHTMTLKKK